MSHLPGTPPLVTHAREVVQHHRRVTLHSLLSATVTAAMCAVGSAFVKPLLFVAMVAWLPVLTVGLSWGPETESLRDSRAILTAWNDRRNEWAGRMVDASLAGRALDQDVAAWSDADRQLRAMGQRATAHT